MKYAYKNHGVKGIAAEVAYAEIERIRAARGLNAENVVDESKAKGAVLHAAFEWNDKKAAHEHRLLQARHLIRSVHVVTEDGTREPVYVHVQRPTESDDQEGAQGQYERVDVVVGSPDLFELALSELRARVSSAMEAVQALERAAQGSTDSERLMKVSLAVKALETAASAISSLH